MHDFFARELNLDDNSLKTIASENEQQYDDLIHIMAYNHDGKALLRCYNSKRQAKKYNNLKVHFHCG